MISHSVKVLYLNTFFLFALNETILNYPKKKKKKSLQAYLKQEDMPHKERALCDVPICHPIVQERG